MLRNTICTLGELRKGDRFVFPKRIDVWQVIDHIGSKKVAVNQFDFKRERIHKHDDLKPSSTKVKFLRHTMPLPGEECMIRDLNPGDVFFLPEDIITEYILIEQPADAKYWLQYGVDDAGNLKELDDKEFVVLVRKANSVIA